MTGVASWLVRPVRSLGLRVGWRAPRQRDRCRPILWRTRPSQSKSRPAECRLKARPGAARNGRRDVHARSMFPHLRSAQSARAKPSDPSPAGCRPSAVALIVVAVALVTPWPSGAHLPRCRAGALFLLDPRCRQWCIWACCSRGLPDIRNRLPRAVRGPCGHRRVAAGGAGLRPHPVYVARPVALMFEPGDESLPTTRRSLDQLPQAPEPRVPQPARRVPHPAPARPGRRRSWRRWSRRFKTIGDMIQRPRYWQPYAESPVAGTCRCWRGR